MISSKSKFRELTSQFKDEFQYAQYFEIEGLEGDMKKTLFTFLNDWSNIISQTEVEILRVGIHLLMTK